MHKPTKRHIILHTRAQSWLIPYVSSCLRCDAGRLLGMLLVDGGRGTTMDSQHHGWSGLLVGMVSHASCLRIGQNKALLARESSPQVTFNRCDVSHKWIHIVTTKHCRKDLANIHPPFKPSVLGGVFPTHLPTNQLHYEKSLLSPISALFN
jgi:hypothetical protein